MGNVIRLTVAVLPDPPACPAARPPACLPVSYGPEQFVE